MTSYLPNGISSKLSDKNETSKGVVVPLYNSKEEMEGALDNTGHLRDWNFRGSKCDRCGLPNSKVDGLLIQCGLCKNAHYCSRKCFNDDLEYHQTRCQSSSLVQQPTAGPDFMRRGDDDYEETEEQRLFIQRRELELAKIRAEQAVSDETKSALREPSPPPREQKVRRSWDWDVLFANSSHGSATTTNHSTTHHSATTTDQDFVDDADDDSVHSFAPEADTAEEAVEPNAPVVKEDEETVEEETSLDDKPEEPDKKALVGQDLAESDSEEDRVTSKQQRLEEFDEEELERHRRRVAKILEADAEHRRRLNIGNGDIPVYKWEPEHVKLTEAELIKRIYGWEVPEWVKNRTLRQTDFDELDQRTKQRNFSQTPIWATQQLKRRSTPSLGAMPKHKEPEWAKKVPLRSKSDDGAGSSPCPRETGPDRVLAQQGMLAHQFSQSLNHAVQSPQRNARRASCTHIDLQTNMAADLKIEQSLPSSPNHHRMLDDADRPPELDVQPGSSLSPSRRTHRSFSQVPSWVKTSPLRRKSNNMLPENTLQQARSQVEDTDSANGLMIVSNNDVEHDMTSQEDLLEGATESTAPPGGDNEFCTQNNAHHEQQAQTDLTAAKLIHEESPKLTKSFSQTPSWAVRSPLKRRSLAQPVPKTVELKAPEWIARPPLRSKSEDGQRFTAMFMPSLDSE